MGSKKRFSRAVRPAQAGMALLVGLSGGCIIKNKKTEAGEGIARLTVRNLGSVVGLLNADATCGFASEAVVTSAVVTGEPGTDGTVVFTVAGCTVAATDVVATDCSGDTKTVNGSFTADATLTINGLITGDPASPVVPNADDAVEFDLVKVDFNEFKVVDSTSTDILTNRSGSISAKIAPRFATAADSGACAIATPNVTFTDVTYSTDSVIFVDTADKDKEVEIGGSKFSAQNGIGGDASENKISGSMVVLGRDVTIDGDGALDPNYDANAFKADYACTENLASPESFECADVREAVAFGTARLSALTFGVAAGIARAQCPFAPAGLSGGLGEDGSVLTLALAADCNLVFPAGTPASTDCNGEVITIEGSYTVKAGSKLEVTGYNVGNAAVGVLPTSRAPALITADIDFTGFSISKSTAPATLTVNSGSLSGEVEPRFFLDTTSGACTVSSPILGTAPVKFNDITWTNGDLTLDNNGSIFNFTLEDSAINAQSGDNDATTNEINGSLSFSGLDITIPPGTELEEGFDQAVFNAAFQQDGCAAGLPATVIAVPDAACSFRQALGQTAAKLLVGTVAGSISTSNALCGATTVEVVNGAPGGGGNEVATTTACTVVLAAALPSADCVGGVVSLQGSVNTNMVRTTTGFVAAVDTVVPNTQTAFSFTGVALNMTGWIFEKLSNGVSLAKLTLTSNVSVGAFNPIFAQSDANSDGLGDLVGGAIPLFSKPTPIFEVVDLTAANGTATLVLRNAAGLLTFNVALSGVALDALVGAFGGESNDISGTLTVDGEPVNIAVGTPFDAAFSQTALDDSYNCVNTDADLTNGLILVPAN